MFVNPKQEKRHQKMTWARIRGLFPRRFVQVDGSQCEPFPAVRQSADRAPNKIPFGTCRAPLRPPAFTALRSSLAPSRPGFVRIRCEEQNQPDRAAKGKNNVSKEQQQIQCEP